MATYLYLFTDEAGQISEQRIPVPAFLGGVEVSISTDVGGFGFSPIADQLVGVPFSVTITALDGDGIRGLDTAERRALTTARAR